MPHFFLDFCKVRLFNSNSVFICFLLVLLGTYSYSQKQDRYWYFGNRCALNFNTNPPTPLGNSNMNAYEGCATASDTSGKLLFYTDGGTVWNANHVPMLNGTGLNGFGSTQAAIIVPYPLNLNLYYIFTVDTNGGPKGLCYNIVDMTLNGGLGDITTKNVLLQGNVSEKLTATHHPNNVDVWVVVHGWNNDIFYSFRVTSTGINLTPATSNVGTVHGGIYANAHGYMKISQNSKRIACAIRRLAQAECFDFNPLSGQVSNAVNLPFVSDIYGLEFSPNSNFLYVANFAPNSDISQFNLLAGSASAIAASKTKIGTSSGFMGALQLGPNGIIYGTQYQKTALIEIAQPNLAGTFSAFTNSGQGLFPGTTSNYGLPNILLSYFTTTDFTYADTCSDAPTSFTLQFSPGVPDSVKWSFSDASSGSSNFSSSLNPQHTFATGGTYDVKVITYQGLLIDSVTKRINIIDRPEPSLGSDLLGCQGNSFTFYPGNFVGDIITWKDNSNGPDYTTSVSDTIWLKVDRLGCIGRDTVILKINPIPNISFGLDKTICSTDTLKLDATTSSATYLWQDGSTFPNYDVTTTGNYGVQVKVGGCIGGDTIFVTANPAPNVFLGNDTTICKGFLLFLDVTNPDPNTTYTWQDGSSNSLFFISDPGLYSVKVQIGTCFDTDSIYIDQEDKPLVFLGEDTVLCAGQPIQLNAYNYGATYEWQDGSTDSIFNPGLDGKYFATATNQCGVSADTIQVTLLTCNCNVFIPNSFSPNSDTKNDVFNYKYTCTEFEATMQIYNRIGQLIFTSNNADLGWDGTFEGKKATEGVYIYELKYSGYNDRRYIKVTKRGTFSLIR